MYSSSFLIYTSGVLQESTLSFFKLYRFLLTIRLTLAWFPNFNPFIQPYRSLALFTDPYLRVFRGAVPSVFNVDISPIFAMLWMQSVLEIFTELASNHYN